MKSSLAIKKSRSVVKPSPSIKSFALECISLEAVKGSQTTIASILSCSKATRASPRDKKAGVISSYKKPASSNARTSKKREHEPFAKPTVLPFKSATDRSDESFGTKNQVQL